MSKLIILFSVLVLSLSVQAKILKCDWSFEDHADINPVHVPELIFKVDLNQQNHPEQTAILNLDQQKLEAKFKLNSHSIGELKTSVNLTTELKTISSEGSTRVHSISLMTDFVDNIERNIFSAERSNIDITYALSLNCIVLP